MSTYLNYLVESNIGLTLFLVLYFLLFNKETDFRMKRFVLVSGIAASLLFPVFTIQNTTQSIIPSVSNNIPSYLLPEFTVGGKTDPVKNDSIDFWFYAQILYVVIAVLMYVHFIIKLISLVSILYTNRIYKFGKLRVIQSTGHEPSFSFFNYIFIGQANKLSKNEKHQIIQHESVHVRQLHSLDILLITFLGIIFWFNPLLRIYRRTLVQLHEFEADAHTVERCEANEYCSLLAKITLQSSGLKLANYFFNDSLTLKRITMIRTPKTRIRQWKFITFAAIIPLVFLMIACQDQIADDLTEIAKNSTSAIDAPAYIHDRMKQLQQENPNSKYVILQLNEVAAEKAEKLKTEYGLPASVEIFQPEEGYFKETGKPASPFPIVTNEITIHKNTYKKDDPRTFAIVRYDKYGSQLSDLSATDNVFAVVEEPATPEGGMEAFQNYLRMNIRYPAQARKAKASGKVFIEFIIRQDGSMTDVKVVKSVEPSLDMEATRILTSGPKWTPGKNKGQAISQKLIFPINFRLDGNPVDETTTPEGPIKETHVVGWTSPSQN